MSEFIPDSELVKRITEGYRLLKGNHLFEHKRSKRLYLIERLVLKESNPQELLVIYHHRNSSFVYWCQPLSEFLEKFDPYDSLKILGAES